MNGKGSKRRPQSVPSDVFQSNWEAIFGKDKDDADKRREQHQAGDEESGEQVPQADTLRDKPSA